MPYGVVLAGKEDAAEEDTMDNYGHYESEEERETAKEILRRRYAKGEITKEQYEQMKKDIIT